MRLPLNTPGHRGAVTVLVFLTLNSFRTADAETLEEYRHLIAECRLAAAQDKVPETRLQNLQKRLSAVDTVTYPGGTTVKVNTHPLAAALRNPSQADLTEKQLALLQNLLTSSAKTSEKGDPRAQASQVLAASEFAKLRKPEKPVDGMVPQWWTRFSKWAKATAERFAEWLGNLLRGRRAANPNVSGIRTFVKFLQFLLYFVAGVAALVGVYLLARTAAARGWLDALRKRRRRNSSTDLDLDLSGDGIADPLGAARALAAQGAYRDAVRMAYIASLRRLQENGLLVLEANRTNWEYQRDLRGRSSAASETLLPATRLFDRLWYGRRAGTAEDFSEAVRVHDALAQLPDEATAETRVATAASEHGVPQ